MTMLNHSKYQNLGSLLQNTRGVQRTSVHQPWWLSCKRQWLSCTSPSQQKRHAVPACFEGSWHHSSLTRWIVLPHPLAKRCCLSCIHAHIFLSWEILSRAAIPWECSDHCFANVWKDESFSKSWDREKNQKHQRWSHLQPFMYLQNLFILLTKFVWI